MEKLIELFCGVDDFLKEFLPAWKRQLLWSHPGKRYRAHRMSESEIITLLIFFQQSSFKNFKHYYFQQVKTELKPYFPKLLSYNRFVEIIPTVLMPLCAYLQSRFVSATGISFIDSTPVAVCHRKRISQHKVFRGLGELGKSTKGWFYGFKLHVICTHEGGLVSCKFTPGNVDDRAPVPVLTKNLSGKLFGDKGYISQDLFDQLFNQGLQLVTGIKKNMKNKLMPMIDKLLLRKRSVIESINNQFKNVFQLEHSRHRAPLQGLVHMVSAVVAYTHHERKPAIKLSEKDKEVINQLAA